MTAAFIIACAIAVYLFINNERNLDIWANEWERLNKLVDRLCKQLDESQARGDRYHAENAQLRREILETRKGDK